MKAAMAGVMPDRQIVARALPFLIYVLIMVLGSGQAFMPPAVHGLDARWLYAWRIALTAAAIGLLRGKYGELGGASAVRPATWLVSLLCGSGVFALWIGLDFDWMTVGGAHAGFVPVDPGLGVDWPLVVVRIFGAAVVVPPMEELFWRSLVQRRIDRADFLTLAPAAVSLRALLLTALAFGFEHRQWLAGIVAGLAYGHLYRRAGNLWPAIVAHGVTNLLLGLWVVATGKWQFW